MAVVFITGASGGIGSAIARRFAAGGYDAALFCHARQSSAELVREELLAAGRQAGVYVCDVADPASFSRAYAAAEADFGVPDALVAAAGLADQRLVQEVDDALYRRLTGVNLDGAFYAVRAALPGMIRRKSGAIVLVSSMWGEIGGSCEAVYSAAKAGVIGLCRAVAKEVAPSGIRVNCVSPGVILTDMVRPLGEETLRALAEETPLGRLGTPDDVAEAVWFLASDAASFITGQDLSVSGGLVG